MVITRQDETASKRGFGKFLVDLRRAHGLTQADLAEKIKMNQSYVAAIEKGNKKASDKFVDAVARALDLRADRLQKIRDLTSVAASVLIPGTGVFQFVRGVRDTLHIRNEIHSEDPEPSWFDDAPIYLYGWSAAEEATNARRKAIADSLGTLTDNELQRVEDFIAGLASTSRPRS